MNDNFCALFSLPYINLGPHDVCYVHCFYVLVKVLGKQCHRIMTKVNKMLIIGI